MPMIKHRSEFEPTKTPISRPHGRYMGVFCELKFLLKQKRWSRYIGTGVYLCAVYHGSNVTHFHLGQSNTCRFIHLCSLGTPPPEDMLIRRFNTTLNLTGWNLEWVSHRIRIYVYTCVDVYVHLHQSFFCQTNVSPWERLTSTPVGT